MPIMTVSTEREGGGSKEMDASGKRGELVGELFACPPAVGALLARRARWQGYAARATILRQADRCSDIYLLATGRARAVVFTLDGRVVRLIDYVPGDMFGALTPNGAQPAEVSAVEAVEAALFANVDFVALAETHACVGMALSRSLVRQLASLAERMTGQLTLSAVGRVHAELLRLARAGDGRRITPVPVLAEIAARVQTTRETVSRTVSALERRGLIRRDADAIVLIAPHRLQDLVV